MTQTDHSDAWEARFTQLVSDSWKRWNEWEVARRADDIALGATITSFVTSGWKLIDIESDGTAHLVRFQSGTDRLVFSITALSEDPVRAKALGRLIRVEVGYGVRAQNFGHVKDALKQEMKSSFIANANEPGVITMDGDLSSGYVYATVPLILDLNDYFDGIIETRPIAGDLYSAVHSLNKYLQGRLAG
jgi:hypothetical protein